MMVAGWILFGFGALRFAVSLVNWLARMWLPEGGPDVSPKLSVLIPARNEEHHLPLLLSDLAACDYPDMEVIVYDDLSDDGTAAVAAGFSFVMLICGGELPPGWLGKNYACHRLAEVASGEKLLFVDADVRLCPVALERALAGMERYRVELLSVFPRQLMPTRGSQLAVPLMNWILLSLLPLPLVRLAPQPSLSAANGQFMLFTRDSYRKMLPHSLFRSEPVEDIAIQREYKRRRLKTVTLLGHRDVSCRMYDTLDEAVEGFSKNIFRFFGGSPAVAFGFAAVTTLAPFWIFIFNGLWAGIAYIALVMGIRLFVSLASGQSALRNLGLMVAQQLVFWKILIHAYIKKRSKQLLWKERNIQSAGSS